MRQRLWAQLNPEGSERLSPINKALVTAILLSVVLGIVGTEPSVRADYQEVLVALELLLGAVFIVEMGLRLWTAGAIPEYASARGLLRFILKPSTLVDLIVIATLLAPVFGAEFAVLRLLRVLRLVALAKFGRYSKALRALGRAIHARRFELGLSVVLASFILLVSATGMYLLEAEAQPELFGSIPRALWWSVATLTTVGYGDTYPITAAGKAFAGVTAMAGIGLIALPTGILASSFAALGAKEHS